MSEKKFKKGDIVQLASGGPKMTVQSESTTPGEFFCVWFSEDGKQRSGSFPPEILVKVT